MKLNKISEPTIAKERYDNSTKITAKLSYPKWVEFIEKNSDYFIWLEDTEKGKQTLANLDKVPESFREGVLKGHNKSRAFAEFNSQKGYYEMYVDFVEKYGLITTTFMKSITLKHLSILLDMANYLDAYLLNNGTEIIDEKVLNTMG